MVAFGYWDEGGLQVEYLNELCPRIAIEFISQKLK